MMLPRRSFLRGVVAGSTVALGLPPLEAMFGGKNARASTQLPPIFGVFFWANGLPWNARHTQSAVPDPTFDPGTHLDMWTPTATGAGYTPSTLLQPLAPFEPTVITGLEPKTNWVDGGESDGHMRGFMVALTSDRVNPYGFHHNSHTLTSERETLDQYVAKHPDFYGTTLPRFRSLVLGVSEARFHTYGHWNSISYNGPSSLNPPITNPGRLYDQLFAAPPDVAGTRRRALLLNSVMAEYHGLNARLGAADRRRLEEHMTHIDEIQRRLELSNASCETSVVRPGNTTDLLEQTGMMAKLLGIGLQCGLTRVFSMMLTSPATPHVFSNLGVINDMHTTCHAGEWQNVRNITNFHMQAFARFMAELDMLPASLEESVLDQCLIYGTSEYGEGWKHGVQEMPVLFAGSGGGRMRRGWHVREAGGNMSKAHVTLLRALGLNTPSYGFHGGETSADFSELYA
jgi:hypothetical protein